MAADSSERPIGAAAMDRSEAWFIQRKRWARPLVASLRGWVAGLVFIAAFFGVCAFFLSLEPFEPLNLLILGVLVARDPRPDARLPSDRAPEDVSSSGSRTNRDPAGRTRRHCS